MEAKIGQDEVHILAMVGGVCILQGAMETHGLRDGFSSGKL